MSSRKSPRRTPARSPASQAFAPTRITRLEEKEELQDLNKRLELYIYKQREKDAGQGVLERELQAVREHAAEEMEHAQQLFNAQLAETRKSRDEESAARAKLEAENKRLQDDLDRAQMELETAREDRERLRSESVRLHGDLNEAELESRKLREEAISSKTAYEVECRKAEALADEVRNSRAAAEEATDRAAEAESRATSLQEDLDMAQDRANSEIARYRKQVDELTSRAAHIEEELRRDFGAQLTELLAERQTQFDREKDEGMAMLKAAYDEKIRAFRDHLERAGHELELLKKAKAKAETERREAVARIETFEEERTVLRRRVEELEEEAEEHASRPSRELAEKNEIIRRIKASFKRKDEEFDELMDVKIALALEIKTYRQMLENEERRLGYKSPTAKKRKRGEDDSGAAHERHNDQNETDRLMISGCDLEGRYITIKNVSTAAVALKGWKLQSSNQEFNLPHGTTLQPRETLTVHAGPGADEREKLPTDVCWTTENPWDALGDSALLLNAHGEIISTCDILPRKFEGDLGGDFDAAATGAPAAEEEDLGSASEDDEEGDDSMSGSDDDGEGDDDGSQSGSDDGEGDDSESGSDDGEGDDSESGSSSGSDDEDDDAPEPKKGWFGLW